MASLLVGDGGGVRFATGLRQISMTVEALPWDYVTGLDTLIEPLLHNFSCGYDHVKDLIKQAQSSNFMSLSSCKSHIK